MTACYDAQVTAWLADYLARIGAPNKTDLAELQYAHLLTVPFENLSIHAREPIRLDPAWLYDKIVRRRRGGFCYELNGLFALLLGELGFRVDRLAARVIGDDGALGIPFDHMCLRVDDVWLVDVGFGDCFVRPLRLDESGEQSDGRRTFRIVRDGDDASILEDAGRPAFRFEHAAHALADFEPGCRYHQTSPESHFTRRRVVSRLTPDGRITLRDDRQITTVNGAKTETPVVDAEHWRRLLLEDFGLVQPLTTDDVQRALAPYGIAIRFFAESTATSQQAADAIGCQLGQIVKSLCFVVKDQPVLVLAAGDQRVDEKKLAQELQVARRQVRTASADECVAIFGYAPGGVPPIAHRTTGIPIYIDATLQRFEQLYAAGGAHDAIFPIAFAQLLHVTHGKVASLARD